MGSSSGGNIKNYFHELGLRVLELNAVEHQKHEHDMSADALVAVSKGVIID